MNTSNVTTAPLWRLPPVAWLYFVAALGLLLMIYIDGLDRMQSAWFNKEEYSHGVLIPAIALFLVWQKSDQLHLISFRNCWAGVFVLLLGIFLYFAGEMATLYIIVQYAFWVALVGVVLSFTGWSGFKLMWVPLVYLLFMIPLPVFLYNNLSLQLQLISSKLGVDFIRLCDISVYLQGNVIDLGSYKLQVVEACNGLRYLFPFMSLSFLAAYIYQGAFWKKATIFLSSIPISVLMNSFRIGVIGVLVDNWGTSAAEGFLHDFEGWVVFMFCLAILIGEMWLLARIGRDKKNLSEVFSFAGPALPPENAEYQNRQITHSAWVALGVLAVAAMVFWNYEKPADYSPNRVDFSDFPLEIKGWNGRRDVMEQEFQDALMFDDYILADFRNTQGDAVNFYVAYYASQVKGRSIHSPRSCLPGGGWVVKNLEPKMLPNGNGQQISVARVLITKGDSRQLVYYWTQQRSRIINNEFLVKWFLFWDGLTKHRSDGALVRFVMAVSPGENVAEADQRLAAFAELVTPMLPTYVPD